MKIMLFCLVLAALTSELPSAAQASLTLDATASKNTMVPATTQMMLKGVHGGGGPLPRTPQQKALEDARMDKINDLTQAGMAALHLKNFAAAEEDYRALVQMEPVFYNYYGLGEALAGQGKTAEALAVYKTAVYWPLNTGPEGAAISRAFGSPSNLRGCSFPTDAVAWMKYALLLSQTGRNAEAFAVYSQAVHLVNDPDRPGITLLSAGGTQSVSEFQSAVHTALGLLTGATSYDPEQAMREFAQALALAPDAAAANYYYGYGWQRLDLKSQTRAANALQAKAALAKAAASEDDTVKKAAAEAIKRIP